jgi:hypothetical protein
MRELIRGLRPSHALVLGGVMLRGVFELVALNRPQMFRQRQTPAA